MGEGGGVTLGLGWGGGGGGGKGLIYTLTCKAGLVVALLIFKNVYVQAAFSHQIFLENVT